MVKKVKIYLFIFFYWVLIVDLLAYFGLSSMKGFVEVAQIDVESLNSPLIAFWISPFQLYESTLFGVFFGLLFIAVNEVSDRLEVEKLSFGRIIIIRSFMYLFGFAVIFSLVYTIMSQFEIFPKEELKELKGEKTVYVLLVMAMLFIGFQIMLINFMLQTMKKFGTNNLFNILRGTYRSPKVENRIFLFIDLKSSTRYAESLGNIKYSNMIKDCIDEINMVVDEYDAEIYQYVGDEVVLTWKTDKVTNVPLYLDIFFAIEERILKRKEYYSKRYSMLPEFKGGIQGGNVTVTEIGNIKRDIAYHGDVLNTASRLQSICNDYNQKLLISKALYTTAKADDKYETVSLGEIQLKGKLQTVEVLSVKRKVD
ncbi:adenylate/guanylate cyclase domain-containing protein [Fulvivirga maritima]|uniref:adenylate/guanylate cyclase domain-containing protein n=1 Tax=Fulvivirga maritima TaxID=2904247 RepID=UPI001F2B71FE|nr:adenylate/guanylate cyclase domain-containing protein [Fulvivirga maritima]UII28202.1 adenylate/guanylate cyclase domain-containing protein [Fulvivirga maritima]